MYIQFDKDMASRISKWGNSLGVRIPKVLAAQAGLSDGDSIEIRLEDGRLIVEPIVGLSYELDDLLEDVREDNIHGEVSTGRAVGSEAWS